MTPATNQWYVEFDGLSYGAFTYAQMQGFVNEGRVVATSLITPDPSRGYFQASAFPAFLQWLSASQEIQHMRQMQEAQQAYAQPEYAQQQYSQQDYAQTQYAQAHPAQAQSAQPQHIPSQHMQAQTHPTAIGHSYTPNPTSEQMRAPALSVFLIMAEIRSAQAMPFLQAMQTFGISQRIGDTVWLLRATSTAENLRTSLSQTLTKQDRLFVLDCVNNKTSWFNIGADMDSRIRELWEETPS